MKNMSDKINAAVRRHDKALDNLETAPIGKKKADAEAKLQRAEANTAQAAASTIYNLTKELIRTQDMEQKERIADMLHGLIDTLSRSSALYPNE